jgi:uncharacterized SAM-dependent methyltransferase
MAKQAKQPSLTSPAGAKLGKAALGLTVQGIAKKYWLELVSLPPGNNNRLWLFVNSTWTFLQNTTHNQQASVQNAFNNGSNLEVAVWYDSAFPNPIKGLVVRTP